MKVYTKHGDKGMTSLASGMQIFKSDERVETLGAVDELTSHIGLARVHIRDEALRAGLQRVQRTLMTLMAGVADIRNPAYALPAEETAFLESEIDRMSEVLPQEFHFVLPGSGEASARLDVARTVARRAERVMVAMDRKYSAQSAAKIYLNRLSDYLYTAARYLEVVPGDAPAAPASAAAAAALAAPALPAKGGDAPMQQQDVVQEVLRRLDDRRPLDLARAKRLIEAVEAHAAQQGKQTVIAVCNAEGNPIAVHVMDGAFLVSYEVALKKAYTAVAVKMSTMQLSKLAQPGGTFYGLANMDKMTVFGGGVPLYDNGRLVGGLGISGGTGEEDDALCTWALEAFPKL